MLITEERVCLLNMMCPLKGSIMAVAIIYFHIINYSQQAHLKGSGMKFVVYHHARESEQSDEWLMVSLIKKNKYKNYNGLCRLVNQLCCII